MLALYPESQVRQATLQPSRPSDRPPFGLAWVRRYLPHYLSSKPSQLHEDLADDLAEISRQRAQRRVYVAPRGSAKTTWISKAYPLHGAVEGIEPLTVLLAETGEQARTYLDAIKTELEDNPWIAADYPAAAGKGPIWQAARIRLRNGCEIIARGSGGRILGVTTRQRRPSLVVVDDGNERGDAYSPTKRKRKLDWFARDVLPVGEPGTNFVVAGTAIHREAIVCDLRAKGWSGRSYKALMKFPDRMELWMECERLATNLADPDREKTGRAFYEANRAAMDEGAELLWPERLDLYMLMAYRWDRGEAAFGSEYGDQPGSPEGAEWPAEYFDRSDFWFDDWPERLVLKVIALDPSKGTGTRGGDYQAHTMLGLDPNGLIWIDADLRQENPDLMCQRTVAIAREFGKVSGGGRVNSIIVEDNGTMGLIGTSIELAVGALLLPWECLTNQGSKDLRIRTVGPYLHRGTVRVRRTPGARMLVEQWREFPSAEHDDGPDSAATGLVRLEDLASLL